ncbi:hypothetical protein AB0H88_17660 [Nonomuraea sp. NPDC050680]|uniref:hypothetical protein n=1 Tax=Nonomuraea sp. NPDC050680 TaxID=3154630 RepID=UPI0033E687B2
MREAASDGIDIYFDNVGGEHLAATTEMARPGARFALCGALKDQLGSTSAAIPVDPTEMIGKRLTLARFHVASHRDLQRPWLEDFGDWVRAERIEGAVGDRSRPGGRAGSAPVPVSRPVRRDGRGVCHLTRAVREWDS